MRRSRPSVSTTKMSPSRSNARRERSALHPPSRSEEHTSELQSQSNLVCRLLLEKKKKTNESNPTTLYLALPLAYLVQLQRPTLPIHTPYPAHLQSPHPLISRRPALTQRRHRHLQ